MAEFSVQDTIGQLLGVYSAREQAKIDARLAASREQIAAYDQASKSQAAAAATTANKVPGWAVALGVVAVGGVLFVVLRK